MKTYCRYLFVLILLTMSAGTYAEDKDYLGLEAGVFEVLDDEATEPAGFLSYRFSPRLFGDQFGPVFKGIGPMLGLMASTDGAVFGHGDLFLDIRPTEKFVIWPSAGVGGYSQGDSIDLGGTFQFHLQVFAGYQPADGHMLGISYQHISNAGIHDQNPAADSIFFSYQIPLPSLF